MPPDLAAALSQDRRRHRRIRVVSATQWPLWPRSWPIPAVQHTPFALHAVHQSVRPHDPPRILAPHIPLLHVVAEGAGS
jgi:hypothetical protein